MLEENIELPFETQVLGVEVTVERIDLTDAEEIVAVCRRGQAQQVVPILHLPLPDPSPQGAEWIEAFRVPVLMDTVKARRELRWRPQHDARSTLHAMVQAARSEQLIR